MTKPAAPPSQAAPSQAAALSQAAAQTPAAKKMRTPIKAPPGFMIPIQRTKLQGLSSAAAILLTIGWFAFVMVSVIKAGGFAKWLQGTPASAAITVSSLMLAPAALFWMILAWLQRATDVQSAMEPMRQMLVAIAGGSTDTRFVRFNAALRDQIALLKVAGHESQRLAREALAELGSQNESLQVVADSSSQRLMQAGDRLKSHIAAFEKMLQSADHGLSSLDNSTAVLAQTLGLRIDAMDTLLQRLSDRIERQAEALQNAAADRLDRAQTLQEEMERRSQAFAQTLKIFGEEMLSRTQDIDQLMGKFDESAEQTRRNTDKTTALLQTQIRSLDQTSLLLRDRAGEATEALSQSLATLESGTRQFEGATSGWQQSLQREGQALADITGSVADRHRATSDHLAQILSAWSGEERQMAERFDAIDLRMQQRVETVSRVSADLVVKTDTLATAAEKSGERLSRVATENTERHANICRVAEAQSEKLVAEVGALLDRQDLLIARLEDQTGTLSAVASDAGGSLTEVSRTLVDRTETLSKLGRNFAEDAGALRLATAEVAANLDGVVSRMDAARLGASETGDHVIGKIGEIANETQRQIATLDGAAASMLRAVGANAELLTQRTQALGSAGETVLAALSAAESTLASKGAQLGHDLDAAAETAIGQVDLTIRRLRSLPPALSEEAARAGGMMTAVAEKLETAAADLAQAMESHVGRMESSGAAARGLYEKSGAELEARRTALAAAADQAAGATRGLVTAQREAESVLGAAAASLIEAAGRIGGEENRLAQQLSATTDAGDRLSGEISVWRGKLSDDSTQMLGSVESSIARLQSLRDSFASTGGGIIEDAARANAALSSTLSKAGGELEGGARQMKDTMQSASSYLAGFGARLTQQIGTLANADTELRLLCERVTEGQISLDATIAMLTRDVAALEERLAGLGDTLAAQGGIIQAQSDSSCASIQQAADAVRSSGIMIETNTQRALEAAAQVAARYRDVTEGGAESLDEALRRLQSAGEAGGQTLADWQKLALEQADVLTAKHAEIARLRDALAQDAAQAQESIARLSERLGAASATAQASSEAATENLGAAASALERNIAFIGNGAEVAENKLAGAAARLRDDVAALGAQAEAASDQLAAAAGAIAASGEQTHAQLSRALDLTRNAGAEIDSAGKRALTAADETAARYKSVARDSNEAIDEVCARADKASSDIARRYEDLAARAAESVEARARQLIEASGGAADALSEWGAVAGDETKRLFAQQAEIDRNTRALQNSVSNASQTLAQLTERMAKTGAQAADAASSAAQTLMQASADIARGIDSIGSGADSAGDRLHGSAVLLRADAAALGVEAESASIRLTAAAAAVSASGSSIGNHLTELLGTARNSGELLEIAARQAREAAASASAEFDALSRKGLDALDDGVRRIAEAGRTGSEALSVWGQQAIAQAGKLLNRQAELEAAAQSLRDGAVGVDDRLTQLTERMASAGAHASEAGAVAAERLALATNDIERSIECIGSEAETAQDRLTRAAALLRQGAAELGAQSGTVSAQIIRVAESVAAQGDAATTRLQTLAKATQESGAVLDSVAQRAQELVAEADASFGTIAQTGLGAVEEAALRLGRASAGSREALEIWGGVAAEQAQKLELRHAELETAASALRATADSAGHAIGQLAGRASGAGDQLETAARRAADGIATAVMSLERDLSAIGDGADSANQKLHRAATSLREDVATLASNADYAVGQVTSLVQKCAQEAAMLRSALVEQTGDVHQGLSRTLAELETVGEILRKKTAGAHEMLDRLAERHAHIAASGNALLLQGGAQFTGAAEELQRVVSAVAAGIAQGIAGFATAGAVLDKAAERARAQAEQIQAQMRQAAERLESGETRAAVSAESAIARLTEISSLIDRQWAGVEQGAERAAASLENAGRGVEREAEQMRQQAHGLELQVRGVTTLAQQMRDQAGSVLRSLQEEAARLAAGMTRTLAEADQVEARWKHVALSSAESAEDSAAQLREASEELSERVMAERRALDDFTAHFESSLASLALRMEQEMTRLAKGSNDAAGQAEEAGRRAAESRKEAVGSLQETASRIAGVGDQIGMAAALAAQAGEMAEGHFTALRSQAEQAARALGDAGDKAAQQVRNLSGELDEAGARTRAMAAAGAELFEKTREIRGGLQAEHEEMVAALTRAMLQLESAEAGLSRHQQGMSARLDDAVRHVAKAGESAATLMENQIGALRLTAQEAGRHIADFGARVGEQRQALFLLGESLEDKARQLLHSTHGAEGDARAILENLENLRMSILTALDQVETGVRTGVDELELQVAHLAEGAHQAVSSVHEAANAVAQETGLLAAGTDQVLAQVMKTTQGFSSGVQGAEAELVRASAAIGDLIASMRDEAGSATAQLDALLTHFAAQGNAASRRVAEATGGIGAQMDSAGAMLAELSARVARDIAKLDAALETVAGSARSTLGAVEMVNTAFDERATEFEERVARIQSRIARQTSSVADALSTLIEQVEAADGPLDETKKAG